MRTTRFVHEGFCESFVLFLVFFQRFPDADDQKSIMVMVCLDAGEARIKTTCVMPGWGWVRRLSHFVDYGGLESWFYDFPLLRHDAPFFGRLDIDLAAAKKIEDP